MIIRLHLFKVILYDCKNIIAWFQEKSNSLESDTKKWNPHFGGFHFLGGIG